MVWTPTWKLWTQHRSQAQKNIPFILCHGLVFLNEFLLVFSPQSSPKLRKSPPSEETEWGFSWVSAAHPYEHDSCCPTGWARPGRTGPGPRAGHCGTLWVKGLKLRGIQFTCRIHALTKIPWSLFIVSKKLRSWNSTSIHSCMHGLGGTHACMQAYTHVCTYTYIPTYLQIHTHTDRFFR